MDKNKPLDERSVNESPSDRAANGFLGNVDQRLARELRTSRVKPLDRGDRERLYQEEGVFPRFDHEETLWSIDNGSKDLSNDTSRTSRNCDVLREDNEKMEKDDDISWPVEEAEWHNFDEEDEAEEGEGRVDSMDHDSDDSVDYVSPYAAMRVKADLEKKEAKKKQMRKLIGEDSEEERTSVETIITVDEVPEEIERATSESSTPPCLKDVDISDSQLKLMNLFNIYPSPEDPGLVPAFWILYPPPAAYKSDGIQMYKDITKVMRLRPMQCIEEMLKTDKISLRYYGIDPSSLKSICDAVTNNSSVQTIDLKDNWLNADACFHLNELLQDNGILTTLNLSGCRIGPYGAKRLVSGLGAAPALTELDVSHCVLEDEGVACIATALYYSATLKSVNFADNDIGVGGAKALRIALIQSDSLQHLNLSWNSLYPKEACKALFDGLTRSKTLIEFDISWNALGKESLPFLCAFLARAEAVSRLNLSGNQFSAEAGVQIGKALSKNVVLEELYIGNNPLRAEGALALVQAITPEKAPDSCMKHLDLENVWAQKNVLQELQLIKDTRPWLKVKLGGVLSNFKIVGPNARKILLKRANYEAMKPKAKKQRKDFGQFVFSLGDNLIQRGKFAELVKRYNLKLSDSLIEELAKEFVGPKKTVDQAEMKTFYIREYPDTKLALPLPEKQRKAEETEKGKKSKGGKGQTEEGANSKSAPQKAKGKEATEKDKDKRKKKVQLVNTNEDETEDEEEVNEEEEGEEQEEEWYTDESGTA